MFRCCLLLSLYFIALSKCMGPFLPLRKIWLILQVYQGHIYPWVIYRKGKKYSEFNIAKKETTTLSSSRIHTNSLVVNGKGFAYIEKQNTPKQTITVCK